MNNRMGVAAIAALMLLAGCGGGGGDSAAVDSGMVIGQSYTVETSDRVVSTSLEPALLEVTHELESGTRTVMLVEGSAELYH
jgi:hypothetical protein